jgi:uncharacterized protein (UPF0276 family)
MVHSTREIRGAGLGLRRELLSELAEGRADNLPAGPDFLEVAPENWMNEHGSRADSFRALIERYPFVTHGLSLSVAGPDPLDEDFVRAVGHFLDTHGIEMYSEHLSYTSEGGHLYDLLPVPFTEEAVHWVAGRVRRVQEIIERPLILENVSYYAAPGAEMSELDFLRAVLEEADCRLLLDINNVYVNSVNHAYDPLDFLRGLPGERIAYGHIAGHYRQDPDLIIDTHGADVIDPVWSLLESAYRMHGVFPTLLERDFNLPPLKGVLDEVAHIRRIQMAVQGEEEVHATTP